MSKGRAPIVDSDGIRHARQELGKTRGNDTTSKKWLEDNKAAIELHNKDKRKTGRSHTAALGRNKRMTVIKCDCDEEYKVHAQL